MIADSEIRKTAANTSDETIEREIEEGIIVKADTLEELAEKIGVPVAEFVATIERYNRFVEQGHDSDFHKSALGLKVEQAPFYATPRKPSVHHTMGGLKIDTQARVINEKGEVIPGLSSWPNGIVYFWLSGQLLCKAQRREHSRSYVTGVVTPQSDCPLSQKI